MYRQYLYQVVHIGKSTDEFHVATRVRKSCVLSPCVYLMIIDKVMKRATSAGRKSIGWGLIKRLEAQDFANDVCLVLYN